MAWQTPLHGLRFRFGLRLAELGGEARTRIEALVAKGPKRQGGR